MPIPLPLPISFRPSIARSGDYMLLATSDSLIQLALDIKSGKQSGLKSTSEFKKLSKDILKKATISLMSARGSANLQGDPATVRPKSLSNKARAGGTAEETVRTE